MKKHRSLLRFIFVIALFAAAFCIIMRWWIPVGVSVTAAFVMLWNLMD